jgi:hypothetical protein
MSSERGKLMNTYWGVVSTRPANAPLTTIDGQPILFDFVTQQAGTPQFWGRYIWGKAQGDLLTADEASFLLNNNCCILLVHYGINPGGDYQAGVQDAMSAITAAQNLGIPIGVTIYGDIETGVATNPDWFFGWWETMSASIYANPGGFYCNPSNDKNAKNFAIPYCAAINDPRNLNPEGSVRFNPPLFASTPRPGCDFDLSYYRPDEPLCVPGSAVIWQYAEQCYKNNTFPKGLWDQDLATDTGYDTMWVELEWNACLYIRRQIDDSKTGSDAS